MTTLALPLQPDTSSPIGNPTDVEGAPNQWLTPNIVREPADRSQEYQRYLLKRGTGPSICFGTSHPLRITDMSQVACFTKVTATSINGGMSEETSATLQSISDNILRYMKTQEGMEQQQLDALNAELFDAIDKTKKWFDMEFFTSDSAKIDARIRSGGEMARSEDDDVGQTIDKTTCNSAAQKIDVADLMDGNISINHGPCTAVAELRGICIRYGEAKSIKSVRFNWLLKLIVKYPDIEIVGDGGGDGNAFSAFGDQM